MNRYLVRLRDRNQITLPAEIVRRLKLGPDALLELAFSDKTEGVELRHAEVIRAGTTSAKRELQTAKDDIQEGRFSTFAGIEELKKDLQERREEEQNEDQGLLPDTILDAFADIKKRLGLIEAQVVKVERVGSRRVSAGKVSTAKISSKG